MPQIFKHRRQDPSVADFAMPRTYLPLKEFVAQKTSLPIRFQRPRDVNNASGLSLPRVGWKTHRIRSYDVERGRMIDNGQWLIVCPKGDIITLIRCSNA